MTGIYRLKNNNEKFSPQTHIEAVKNMPSIITAELMPWVGIAHTNTLSGDQAKAVRDGSALPIGKIASTGYKGLTREIPFKRNDDGTLTFLRDCSLWYQIQFHTQALSIGKLYVYLMQYVNGNRLEDICGRGSDTMEWKFTIAGGYSYSFKKGDTLKFAIGTNCTTGFLNVGIGTCYFSELFSISEVEND